MNTLAALIKLELRSFFGINVLLHTKDSKVKKKCIGVLIAWIILGFYFATYISGLVYSFNTLGIIELIPSVIICLSSIIIFTFGIFKSGGLIFRQTGIDIISSLPVKSRDIVLARFVRFYAEELILCAVTMGAGLGVYSIYVKPGALFFLMALISLFFVPLVPIALATFVGALITGLTSGMKKKSLFASFLQILFAVGIIYFSSTSASEFSEDFIKSISSLIRNKFARIYPLGLFFGDSLESGSLLTWLLCLLVSLAIAALTLIIVSRFFSAISSRIFSSGAKGNYRMTAQKGSGRMPSLIRREFRRYFASSIYVTNTIIAPIMALALCIALLVMGNRISELLPSSMNLTAGIPFVLAIIFALSPPTCACISIEGKNWWLLKSLPLSNRDILGAKLLMSLVLFAPSLLICEVLMFIALKPTGPDILFMLIIPACLILMSCIFGLFVNLKMPNFNWDNEAEVVKQGASVAIGGICCDLVIIAMTALVFILPPQFSVAVRLFITVLALALSLVFHKASLKINLRELS